MAISFVGASSGADTATIACNVGDLIVITAWAVSATPPALGSGFTNLATVVNGSVSGRIGYRIATTGSDSSGTWTGAVGTWAMIYRGTGSSPGAFQSLTGTSATVGYPALTLNQPGSSWVLRPAAAVAATNLNSGTLTGYTMQAGGVNMVCWDSNGPASSPGAGSQSVNASGAWLSFTVEIPPPTAPSGGTFFAMF